MNETNTMIHERRHLLENRIPPPLVVILIGLVMVGIAWLTPAALLNNTLRFAAGGSTIALGILIVVQGARTFWRNKTTIDPVELARASTLVTSGIFRYSRNPMYVGFTTVLVGWSIVLAAPPAFLGPVVFVIFTTRFQIIPEERMMRAKFGKTYEDYCAQTRRWL